MGVLYEGEHVDVERRVALKILRHEFCRDAEAVRSFRDEARATSRIGSDAILQVYDFAELPDGRLMIAMELLAGHDLLHELPQPVEPGRAIGILRQVCRGLQAAHDAGIVHRDVKPENIFLTRAGHREDKVKIVDFGIALVAGVEDASAHPAGTVHYLAPEAILYEGIDARVDQYALGCMAYELLTGRLPHDGDTVREVLRAHVEAEPPPMRRFVSDLPAALERVVLRCIARDPERRFVDMRDLEAALCEAQVEAGLVTGWDDLPLPDVEPSRRERLLAAMPDPHGTVVRRSSRARRFVFAAALVMGASATTWALSAREPPAEVQRDPVAQAVVDARAAAAKAFFVYPPADAPQTPTAFSILRGLERRTSAGAHLRATELRAEFAETLARLGDEYWERDGGRAFAVGYYEQALLFDPLRMHAADRVSISAAALQRLHMRASEQAFSEEELIAVEPLRVLADPQQTAPARALAAWQTREHERAAHVEAAVARIATPRAPAEPRAAAPTPIDRPVLAAPTTAAPLPTAPARDVARAPVVAEPKAAPAAPTRDPKAAVALASQARTALAGGRAADAQALFERALGKDNRSVAALAGLRDVAFDRAQYGRAVGYGERVVALARRDADHHLHLGDGYYKVARYADASRSYRRALELGDERARWRLDKAEALAK